VKDVSRNTLLVLAAVALLIGACNNGQKSTESTSPEKTEGVPVIAADNVYYNWGKVKEGKVVEHIFKFVNEGNSILEIKKATGSPGCAVTVISTDKIPPGGEGEIKATIDTKGRAGHTRKRVTVSSNDPKTPEFFFTFGGEIIGDLMITPHRIIFTNVKKSEKATTDILITVNEPKKIKLSSLKIRNPYFDIRQKEGTPEKGGVYEVTFNGVDTFGTTSSEIRITLEDPDKPVAKVLVSAIVSGNVSYPRKIFFQKIGDKFPPKNFTIATQDDANLTISKIEDLDNLLNLKIEGNRSSRVAINATVADQKIRHDENFSHKIILHTDDRDEPKIEIKYRIINRERKSMGKGIHRPNQKGKTGSTSLKNGTRQ
jgi:hypothetical protein